MKLTTHSHLVLRLRMYWTTLPLSSVSLWHTQKLLYLYRGKILGLSSPVILVTKFLEITKYLCQDIYSVIWCVCRFTIYNQQPYSVLSSNKVNCVINCWLCSMVTVCLHKRGPTSRQHKTTCSAVASHGKHADFCCSRSWYSDLTHPFTWNHTSLIKKTGPRCLYYSKWLVRTTQQ